MTGALSGETDMLEGGTRREQETISVYLQGVWIIRWGSRELYRL